MHVHAHMPMPMRTRMHRCTCTCTCTCTIGMHRCTDARRGYSRGQVADLQPSVIPGCRPYTHIMGQAADLGRRRALPRRPCLSAGLPPHAIMPATPCDDACSPMRAGLQPRAPTLQPYTCGRARARCCSPSSRICLPLTLTLTLTKGACAVLLTQLEDMRLAIGQLPSRLAGTLAALQP